MFTLAITVSAAVGVLTALGDVTYASTLAGAVAPILTALLFIPVRMLIRKVEANHEVTRKEAEQLRVRLAEAEATIRGDLRNGIKKSLDQVVENTTPEPPRQAS
jgi:hypothetical protein